jgi:hypothetical protein
MTKTDQVVNSLDYISSLLAAASLDLSAVAQELDSGESEFYPRGTILKASPDQLRFKPKSMWVSQGDGTYKHITGKKGLVTTHDRLEGYTDVIFSA